MQELKANTSTQSFIHINIAPQLGIFSQAVAFGAFYQSYTIQKVSWKILNEKPVNVLLANGAHYSVPTYYCVDLVNDQLPAPVGDQYLKYEKVRTGILSQSISGSFKPYTSLVSSSDRSFLQNQKITTQNVDIPHWGCSILINKDMGPAVNQVYALRLILTATVKFNHFDGVAVLAKDRMGRTLLDYDQVKYQKAALAKMKGSQDNRVFTLEEVRALLAKGNIQKNPGPDESCDDQEPPL